MAKHRVAQLAQIAYDALEKRTRNNGETFYCFADNAPEWLTDMAHKAHGQMLPDDYIYGTIRDSLAAFSDMSEDDEDETIDQVADDVEIYSSRLAAWLGSHGNRWDRADEALEELGKPERLAQVLQYAQSQERREIAQAVFAFLDNNASEDEDEA